MFDPDSIRFFGPLAPYANGWLADLLLRGYTPLSARKLLRLGAQVSLWLASHSLEAGDLTPERVEAFSADRQWREYTSHLSPRALAPLLHYLRGLGVLAIPEGVGPDTPTERLLRDYSVHLANERGLVPHTVRVRLEAARTFLTGRPGGTLEHLTAVEIVDVFRRGAKPCLASGLRSFLRFAHLRGVLTADLSGAVPSIAGWRQAGLPKSLTAEQAERLIHLEGSSSVVAHRKLAVLSLLLRLGLRAREVAALRLDDIDWRAGEIIVRGKGRRRSRLPLPADVGQALVAYVQCPRPPAVTRHVFLRSRAPHGALTTSGVITLVRNALRAIGVESGGAHLLRHTTATQMLRQGASLSDISHVLRHQHVDTTAIYAKVDDVTLRRLARPWPGGAA